MDGNDGGGREEKGEQISERKKRWGKKIKAKEKNERKRKGKREGALLLYLNI